MASDAVLALCASPYGDVGLFAAWHGCVLSAVLQGWEWRDWFPFEG